MNEQARSLLGGHSPLWWVGLCSLTLILVIVVYGLTRLFGRKAPRVPHPKKSVAEGQPEVIIVGSGILGSSLAAALGQDGRRVTVIERDMSEPDRIVGEILQPGGVKLLKELHLQDCLENIEGQPMTGFVLHNMKDSNKHLVHMSLPDGQDGITFHHGRFVQNLRKAAMAEDTITYIEGVVLEMVEEDGATVGVKYRLKGAEDSKELRAPLIVVADGIYSKFRRGLNKAVPQPTTAVCGVMMHNERCYPNRGKMCLTLTPPSYLAGYSVSPSSTRMFFEVPDEPPADLKSYIKKIIYPYVPDDIAGPFLEAVEAGNYRVIATNYLHANPVLKPGVIILGDAMNMRHPMNAGGMSAALVDTLLVRYMLRKVTDLYDYSTIMDLYWRVTVARKHITYTVNVLTYLVYRLFVSHDYHEKRFVRGLMLYFDLKGYCHEGSTNLIGLVTPQPHILMTHLTLSMLYAMGVVLKEEGLLRLPLGVLHAGIMFLKVGYILGTAIWGEVKPLVFG